jgi:hypothetical protein
MSYSYIISDGRALTGTATVPQKVYEALDEGNPVIADLPRGPAG